MAIFWALEILPVAVTGLFPIVLLPVLGLRSPDNASSPYFREENVLFLCCLMIAITVECSNVHRRIALRILKSVGTRFSVLVLAFMLVTAVFGILINNSAATAMMVSGSLFRVQHLINQLTSKCPKPRYQSATPSSNKYIPKTSCRTRLPTAKLNDKVSKWP